jgi:hypothetical protein
MVYSKDPLLIVRIICVLSSQPGPFTFPVTCGQLHAWLPDFYATCILNTPVFWNWPFYIPVDYRIHMFSQTSPCPLLPNAYFPLVRPMSQAMQSSYPMRVGWIVFLLHSKIYITGIPVDGLFCLATCCTLVSCSADFRLWHCVSSKLKFAFGLHGTISQEMATINQYKIYYWKKNNTNLFPGSYNTP